MMSLSSLSVRRAVWRESIPHCEDVHVRATETMLLSAKTGGEGWLEAHDEDAVSWPASQTKTRLLRHRSRVTQTVQRSACAVAVMFGSALFVTA